MHLAPLACADKAFALTHAACGRDQQAPGKIGDAIGQHVGRVADLHAASMGRFDINGFVAHAPTANRFQIGQGVDQFG
ncbi:Uncharacterised protein [Bordetella avium]|nr:Uncharacterised protein [Bordetella avium]